MSPSISGGTLSFSVASDQSNGVSILSLVIYTFTVNLQYQVPSDGIIKIELPDNLLFHKSSSDLKVNQIGSNNAETTLSTSTSSKYATHTNFNFLKEVLVKGACASGCPDGKVLNLKLYDQLYSPYSTLDLSTYSTIRVNSYTQSLNVIDAGSLVASTLKSTVLTEFPTVSFTRSSSDPGVKTITLDISITLTDLILEANSVIRTSLPTDQVQLLDNSQSNTPVCKIYVSNVLQSSTTPCPLISYSSTDLVFDINEFCSATKTYCPNNSVLKFQVSNVQNALSLPANSDSRVLVNTYKGSLSS